MKRRLFLHAALGAGAPALAAAPPLCWRRCALTGFGTTLTLQAAHEDEARVEQALDAAVACLRRIEAQMSLFDAGSALSRLNRDGELRQPPLELLQVLRAARTVSARSNGAFDVTVQPLWQAWAAAQREGRTATPTEVAAARALVGWRQLDIGRGRLRFLRPGMGATLNGIAQGYAADRVRAVLAAHGVRHALIDAGEYATLGRNAENRPWALGIADPRHEAALIARLVADGRCIATSADDPSCFSPDHRHHHIFDPHTGDSPPELAGVTVAAPSCTLADALTKVFFVAGPRRAPELARAWGVDVLLVDKAGRWQATPGLAVQRIG